MHRRFLSTLVAAGMALAPAMLAQSSQQRDRERRSGAAQGAQTDKAGSADSHGAQRSGSEADRTSAGAVSEISGKDRKFIMDAAQDGMVEVELGRLAQQKASSPDVKSFGQKMVDDHTKAGEELKTIASAHNVTLPSDLEAKQRVNIDRLSKLEGEQFDKAYAQYMVQDHKKAVSLFDKTSKSAKNDAIKQFAAKTLPTLRDHLQNAQTLQSATSSTGTASRQKSTSSSQNEAASDAGRTGREQSGSTSGSGRTGSQSQRNPDTTRQP